MGIGLLTWLSSSFVDREALRRSWKDGDSMFGKPNWFKEKQVGWGVTPVSWQGWSYAVIWGVAIALPFILLISSHKVPEAFVWLAVSGGLLVWDVRQVLTVIKHEQKEDLFVIDENETESGRLATKKYDLYVGKSG